MPRDAPAPCVDDAALRAFLERRAALHLYEIGDLAEPFRSRTKFFASFAASGEIDGVVLLYEGSDPPTLLAFAGDDAEHRAALALLGRLAPSLPERVYAHLTPGLDDAFASFTRDDRGRHFKYVLRRSAPRGARAADRLGLEHAAEIRAFLDDAYPGNFFHERVLESRMAFGVRQAGTLRAFAGLHVLAPGKVAAIGNVATHPDARGRGYARRCLVALIDALEASGVTTIGLNVEDGLLPAIRLYEGLGFERAAAYDEAIYARV